MNFAQATLLAASLVLFEIPNRPQKSLVSGSEDLLRCNCIR